MAKIKSFTSSFGMSLEINGIWHKFNSAIEVEPEEGDDFAKIKKMAHDTVVLEVELQIEKASNAYQMETIIDGSEQN